MSLAPNPSIAHLPESPMRAPLIRLYRLGNLGVLASWIFFPVMAYFIFDTLEHGPVIFWIGSAIFLLFSVYFLSAGLRKKRGGLAWLGTLIIAPGLLCGWLLREAQPVDGIGIRDVPLVFTVVDANTNEPIPNALVRILEGFDKYLTLVQGEAEGRTRSDGTVELRPELIFTFRSKPFLTLGTIRFWDKVIECSAEGFQPLSADLSEYTDRGMRLDDPPLPPVTVKMKRRVEGE